jgi:hypothetical protein
MGCTPVLPFSLAMGLAPLLACQPASQPGSISWRPTASRLPRSSRRRRAPWASTPPPATTARATSCRCRPTSWSCGSRWSRSASRRPCSGSCTARSAWWRRSGACASTTRQAAGGAAGGGAAGGAGQLWGWADGGAGRWAKRWLLAAAAQHCLQPNPSPPLRTRAGSSTSLRRLRWPTTTGDQSSATPRMWTRSGAGRCRASSRGGQAASVAATRRQKALHAHGPGPQMPLHLARQPIVHAAALQ